MPNDAYRFLMRKTHVGPFPWQSGAHPTWWLPWTPVLPGTLQSQRLMGLNLQLWLGYTMAILHLDSTVTLHHCSLLFFALTFSEVNDSSPQPLHLLGEAIKRCIGRLPHLAVEELKWEENGSHDQTCPYHFPYLDPIC